MAMLDHFLALLYPPRCPFCRRAARRPEPQRLCRACLARLEAIGAACPRCAEPGEAGPCPRCRRAPPAFASAQACFVYRATGDRVAVRDAIVRWKYRGDLVLGAALARLFADRVLLSSAAYDVVVPVPLHPSRLARRGFNQAAILATALARTGAGRLCHALRRTRFEHSQTALARAGRQSNVSGRFLARRPRQVRGERVLLVDDVLTSGATAEECARALLAAGALRVDVRTLARATSRAP